MFSHSFTANVQRQFRAITPWLLLATLPFLFIDFKPAPGSYPQPRSLSVLQDLAHIPLFLMVSALLTQILPLKKLYPLASIALQIAILVTVGAIIEALQSLSGREASWRDLRLDCLGIVLFFSLFRYALIANVPLRCISIAAALCWLLLEMTPLARALIDEQTLRSQPQLISDFETWGQQTRWSQGQLVVSPRRGQALKVPLPATRYAGTKIDHLPRDWTDYTTLELELFNPERLPLSVILKIEDTRSIAAGYRYDMRYNGELQLLPGWNQFSVPLQIIRTGPETGQLDLEQIVALSLFEIDRKRPGYLLLDNLILK